MQLGNLGRGRIEKASIGLDPVRSQQKDQRLRTGPGWARYYYDDGTYIEGTEAAFCRYGWKHNYSGGLSGTHPGAQAEEHQGLDDHSGTGSSEIGTEMGAGAAGCQCQPWPAWPAIPPPPPVRTVPVNMPIPTMGVTIATLDTLGNITIKVDQPSRTWDGE